MSKIVKIALRQSLSVLWLRWALQVNAAELTVVNFGGANGRRAKGRFQPAV